jgi:hypothetical protein
MCADPERASIGGNQVTKTGLVTCPGCAPRAGAAEMVTADACKIGMDAATPARSAATAKYGLARLRDASSGRVPHRGGLYRPVHLSFAGKRQRWRRPSSNKENGSREAPVSHARVSALLEVVLHGSADLQVVGLVLRIGCYRTRFVRPVEKLKSKIHFRQDAKFAEAGDADFRSLSWPLGLFGCQLHISGLGAGSGLRCGSRARWLRLRCATDGLFLESQGRQCCAQQHDRQATYMS